MKKYLMLPLLLLLAACGFRLAGSDPALNPPLPYQTWAVQGRELQQNIETSVS